MQVVVEGHPPTCMLWNNENTVSINITTEASKWISTTYYRIYTRISYELIMKHITFR